MNSPRNPNTQTTLGVPVVGHPTSGRTAVAQGVADVGEELINFGVERTTGKLTDDLMQAQTDFLGSLDETEADPILDGLDLEGKDVVDQFVAVHARLQDAAEQGTVPITELKIKQERILRDYMRRYPRLTENFQRAASGILGYNPIGAEINALSQANQMRQSQAIAVMDMVHKAAQSAGVPAQLLLSNPRAYYSKAWQYAQDNEEMLRLDRNLKAMNSIAGINKHQARSMLRSGRGAIVHGVQGDILDQMGVEMNRYLGRGGDEALSWAESIARMDPSQIKNAMDSGLGDRIRTMLAGAKRDFIVSMQNDYFANSDMTMAELETELKPALDLYDYAMANISDVNLSTRLRNLADGAKSDMFVRYPELHALTLLSEIAQNERVAAAIGMTDILGVKITERVQDVFLDTLGGRSRITPSALIERPAIDGRGRLQPSVEETRVQLTGDKESDAKVLDLILDQSWRFIGDALTNVQPINGMIVRSDEDRARRNQQIAAGVGGLVAWARTYNEHFVSTGRLLPAENVQTFLDIIANEAIAPVFARDNEATRYARDAISISIGNVLVREANESRLGYQNELRASLGQDMGDTSYHFLMEPKWDSTRGAVQFHVREQDVKSTRLPTRAERPPGSIGPTWLTGGGLRTRAAEKQLRETVERLNSSRHIYMFSRIVRAQAHLEGHTNYDDVVLRNYMDIFGIKAE